MDNFKSDFWELSKRDGGKHTVILMNFNSEQYYFVYLSIFDAAALRKEREKVLKMKLPESAMHEALALISQYEKELATYEWKVTVDAEDGSHIIGATKTEEEAVACAMDWLGKNYEPNILPRSWVSMYGSVITVERRIASREP